MKDTGPQSCQHEYGAWYDEADGSCRQKRICQHCQQVETITNHKWGPWSSVAADSCAKQQICQQCGQIYRKGTSFLRCPHCDKHCLERKSKKVKPSIVVVPKASLDWEDLNQAHQKVWYVCIHCHSTFTESEIANSQN